MLAQLLRVAVAVLVEQTRRALDVRERKVTVPDGSSRTVR
jgi:hypothetical protein